VARGGEASTGQREAIEPAPPARATEHVSEAGMLKLERAGRGVGLDGPVKADCVRL
jgi:hypothetical protein